MRDYDPRDQDARDRVQIPLGDHAEDNPRLLVALSAAAQAWDARRLADLFAAETRRRGFRKRARPAVWDPSQATHDEEPGLVV